MPTRVRPQLIRADGALCSTQDAHAREAAIAAADNLVSRFQEKGQFIQA